MVQTGAKGIGPAPEKAWNKPIEVGVPEEEVVKPVMRCTEVVKPVMRCTPEMALQMLQLMQAHGIEPGSVVFEIV